MNKKEIEKILRKAVNEDLFEVYYQPIFSIHQNNFIGAEALIRLNHKDYGDLSPAVFIPIAEESNLILEIGDIVFEKVCRFLCNHDVKKLGLHSIDVNLSVVQCMQKELAKQLIATMEQFKISPSMIKFEVTETAIAHSIGLIETTMKELIAYGCQFAVDDFGTGYSNISYVTLLPFQGVKIDREFVWSASISRNSNIALRHIIAMFHELEMSIIVEGVETYEQLQMIVGFDCNFVQGYYYSKPIKEDDLIVLLRDGVLV